MMTRLKNPQRYTKSGQVYHDLLQLREYFFRFVCRFAQFIEGEPHLRDEEILDYETSHIRDETDDSDIATDDDSEIDGEDEC